MHVVPPSDSGLSSYQKVDKAISKEFFLQDYVFGHQLLVNAVQGDPLIAFQGSLCVQLLQPLEEVHFFSTFRFLDVFEACCPVLR